MQIVLKDIKERKMQSLACPVRSELRQTTLSIHITFLKPWMTCCRGGIKADTWILTKCPQFCTYSMCLLNEKNDWSQSREWTTVQWLCSLFIIFVLLPGCVWFFVTPWTVAHQAPLSMEFSCKNTGVGCHFLPQGIFLTQGLNLSLLHWQVDSLLLCHLGSPLLIIGEGLIWKNALIFLYLSIVSSAHLVLQPQQANYSFPKTCLRTVLCRFLYDSPSNLMKS